MSAPGPWWAEQLDELGNWSVWNSDHSDTIVEDVDTAATAHLMAAAPDLYAALAEARFVIVALVDEAMSPQNGTLDVIDAAMRKAKGAA